MLNNKGKRILAADMGEQRVGLAISDELGMLAHPLCTIKWSGFKKFIAELQNIINENKIDKLIVGVPYTLKGGHSKKTREIKEICIRIRDNIDIELIEVDERLTTKMAEQTLQALGKKPSKNRDKIDQIAAVYILQSYLDRSI
ncbi:MAG: Holliday junction resolvase RuvX [Calditrichaceae bacterium]